MEFDFCITLLQVYHFYAPVYSTVQHLWKVDCYGRPSSIVCGSSDGVIKILTTRHGDTFTTIFCQQTLQVLNKSVIVIYFKMI